MPNLYPVEMTAPPCGDDICVTYGIVPDAFRRYTLAVLCGTIPAVEAVPSVRGYRGEPNRETEKPASVGMLGAIVASLVLLWIGAAAAVVVASIWPLAGGFIGALALLALGWRRRQIRMEGTKSRGVETRGGGGR